MPQDRKLRKAGYKYDSDEKIDEAIYVVYKKDGEKQIGTNQIKAE